MLGTYDRVSHFLRHLFEVCEYDSGSEDKHENILWSCGLIAGEDIPHKISDVLYIRDRLYPSYTALELEKRVRNVFLCRPEHPGVFWMMLGQDELDHECFAVEQGILFAVIVQAMVVAMKRCTPENLECWRSILRQAVEKGGHLYSSSLSLFLRRYFNWIYFRRLPGFGYRLADKVLTLQLKNWIKELSAAGADLVEYGRHEHKLLMEPDADRYLFWFVGRRARRWGRVINFTYG